MPDIGKLEALKNHYVNVVYNAKVKQQEIDDTFYEETFDVPQIIAPVDLMRTGTARRLIDDPASHIVTSNPQASRRDIKETTTESGANHRILSMLNNIWLPSWKRSNPNPYKQHVKYQLSRGEAWLQWGHNERWVATPRTKQGLPVWCRIPDPMIVYASTVEDEDGVPENIFLVYERTYDVVRRLYPDWTDPKATERQAGHYKATVSWWEYWDKDYRVFNADSEPVLKSEDSPYGFVPFCHQIAPFGTDSPSGAPEKLIVSRLKFSRDTLRRESALISSTDYAIHTYSNRSFDVQSTDPTREVPDDFEDKYIVGTGMVHKLPSWVKIDRAVDALPEMQIFEYLQSVWYNLEMENPLALAGQNVGGSGRLQDIVKSDALVRYAPIIENTESAFSVGVGMSLKMLDVMPGLRPDDIKRGDFAKNYEVKIKLKAEDPIENDRRVTMGSRLRAQNHIDPITFLVDFLGYTKERAEEIQDDKMMWGILETNPYVAEFLGWKLIQKSGMADELQEFIKQRQIGEQQGVVPPMTPNAQQRAKGEVKTAEGFNMMDTALTQRGQRTPPSPYQRQ